MRSISVTLPEHFTSTFLQKKNRKKQKKMVKMKEIQLLPKNLLVFKSEKFRNDPRILSSDRVNCLRNYENVRHCFPFFGDFDRVFFSSFRRSIV